MVHKGFIRKESITPTNEKVLCTAFCCFAVLPTLLPTTTKQQPSNNATVFTPQTTHVCTPPRLCFHTHMCDPSTQVDIWALGVTCYELVTGWFPFDGADKAEIKKAILDHRMRPFPGQGLSPQAISFIKAMLSPNPDARPSAEALMNHVFVQSHLHGTPLLKAPTRRGVALQVRAGPPTKAGKKGTVLCGG